MAGLKVGGGATSLISDLLGKGSSDGSQLNTELGSSATKLQSSTDGNGFMSQMQAIQGQMQQDSVDKARLDAQNSKIKGIADSAAQAGSAASQVKIQY
ncbi:hypothetical protein [Erwinia tasmaniensis]|uniref:hypothetical protein n=1 Tax=Erwinia tasmaniensis TaxID=338565 RepID=UPI003A4DCB7B